MEDHGTVYETRTLEMREQIAAKRQIWTKDTAEHHGQSVDSELCGLAALASGGRRRRLPPRRRASCDPLRRRDPARSTERRLGY